MLEEEDGEDRVVLLEKVKEKAPTAGAGRARPPAQRARRGVRR
jgi:hypothetical protein